MTGNKGLVVRLGGRTVAVLALLSMTFPANAAQLLAPTDSFGAALVRTGAALLFILGLFFLFVYLAKRYFPNVFGGTVQGTNTENTKIELLATRPIGPKRFLHLIRIGKREFLVGSSEQGVNKLGEWESASSPETNPQLDEPSR